MKKRSSGTTAKERLQQMIRKDRERMDKIPDNITSVHDVNEWLIRAGFSDKYKMFSLNSGSRFFIKKYSSKEDKWHKTFEIERFEEVVETLHSIIGIEYC